ncbi:extracellular matrix regulator RemB [Defluviitalea phaphyphila]|uniref:extracellular matrix regulator RemB n=1 Tax=Defluviitalea phaphyphila TaxID=1473580 RepID=UPI0007300EFC|nr:extracellular matrix/biofilm biosynthesis regulator RemA family protein [Defluviitalea phaphyphila]
MFLHIGEDIEIFIKDLVGIFDIKSLKVSNLNNELIKEDNKNNNILNISQSKDKIKSIVIVKKKEKNIIYLSPISSTTLKKRIDIFLE